MPSAREQEGLWAPDASESGMESFNGLELAEAPTSPARLEDQPDLHAQSADPNPAPQAAEASTTGAAPQSGRRGRGGRPRVTGDQDQRILEVFERAKEAGRSLKDAAQELAKELGQPAEYINQRYYYLRRRNPPTEAQAPAPAAAGRRRRAADQAEQPAAPRVGGRGGRRAAAARAVEPTPAAAAAAPPRRRGRAAAPVAPAVEQRLAELSDIATRQLGALTERMERIEERLSALERRPATTEVGDEELYSRLGRMLVRAAFGALESGR